MNSLSENLLIRSSDLFKDFVTLSLEQFDKVKVNYDKKKIPQFIKDYYDLNGKIDITVNDDKENSCSKILIDIKNKNNLFLILQQSIKSLVEEIKVMKEKLENVSLAFKNLSNAYSISLNGKYMEKTFNSLHNLFINWSKSYNDQMNFFTNDILEFFRFMDQELQVFKNLDDSYCIRRKNYFSYKKQFNSNLENPSIIMKIKSNFISSQNLYGFILNKYYDEYYRLNEVHSNRLKQLIDVMNKKKDVYFVDMLKLVELLNIKK